MRRCVGLAVRGWCGWARRLKSPDGNDADLGCPWSLWDDDWIRQKKRPMWAGNFIVVDKLEKCAVAFVPKASWICDELRLMSAREREEALASGRSSD